MHVGKQHATELHVRPPLRQQTVDGDHGIQIGPLPRGQFVKFRSQAPLQIFHDHRDQGHISNAITHEGIANEFGTQGAQVYYTGSAYERADKTHHEIDRVIGRENAQIPHPRPEGIPRGQNATLFQIVFLRQDAALGSAGGSR
jgi:hypothetical protein